MEKLKKRKLESVVRARVAHKNKRSEEQQRRYVLYCAYSIAILSWKAMKCCYNYNPAIHRKAWVKRQRIAHSYGVDDDEEEEEYLDPSELRQGIEESIATGTAHPPSIPSTLPTLPNDIDVCIGGRGCKKCGSFTHKRSNHKDCPYNKQHQHNESMEEESTELQQGSKDSIATSQSPSVSSMLPTLPNDISGRGCKKCGSLTHKRSSHKDCPYNKRH